MAKAKFERTKDPHEHRDHRPHRPREDHPHRGDHEGPGLEEPEDRLRPLRSDRQGPRGAGAGHHHRHRPRGVRDRQAPLRPRGLPGPRRLHQEHDHRRRPDGRGHPRGGGHRGPHAPDPRAHPARPSGRRPRHRGLPEQGGHGGRPRAHRAGGAGGPGAAHPYEFPGDKIPIIKGSALKALRRRRPTPRPPSASASTSSCRPGHLYPRPPAARWTSPSSCPWRTSSPSPARHGGHRPGGARDGQGQRRGGDRRPPATQKTVCTGVEMFRKLLDQGQAGDNIGVLLRGVKREDVERGQVVAKPGSITPHTKFKAEVYILTKEEGGRHTPFFNGYRPQFYFRTTDVTGVTKLPEGVEMVMPGDNITIEVDLIRPSPWRRNSASPSARAAGPWAPGSCPRCWRRGSDADPGLRAHGSRRGGCRQMASPRRYKWRKSCHGRAYLVGVSRVQAPELFDDQKPAEDHGPGRVVQVLSLVPEAHAAPGNEVGGGRRGGSRATHRPVALTVERRTPNPKVGGSNPSRPATMDNDGPTGTAVGTGPRATGDGGGRVTRFVAIGCRSQGVSRWRRSGRWRWGLPDRPLIGGARGGGPAARSSRSP